MMKKFYFTIGITLEEHDDPEEVRDYVQDAVTYWGGQRHPGDPLFGIKDENVTVHRIGPATFLAVKPIRKKKEDSS